MKELKFTWNIAKAKTNFEKHGVTFEEAKTVFLDNQAIEFSDPEHSVDEDIFELFQNTNLIFLQILRPFRAGILCFCTMGFAHR